MNLVPDHITVSVTDLLGARSREAPRPSPNRSGATVEETAHQPLAMLGGAR